MCSAPSWSGDLPKCLANCATCRMYPRMVVGAYLRIWRSSSIRCRNAVMTKNLLVGKEITTPHQWEGAALEPFSGYAPLVVLADGLVQCDTTSRLARGTRGSTRSRRSC